MGTLSWRKLTPTAQGIHNSHGSATGWDVANVPKGWHIPEGLTRVTGQLCCAWFGAALHGPGTLPKGLGLGRRFLQIPSAGNPHGPVSDGGDGAC